MDRIEPMKTDTCSLITLDHEGRIQSITPEMEVMLGIQTADYQGKQPESVNHQGIQLLLGNTGVIPFTDSTGSTHQLLHKVIPSSQVPGNALEIHIYQDQSPFSQLRQENERLRSENHELQLTDAITHLMTERAIQLALEPQVSRCRRYDSPLTLVKLTFQAKNAHPDSVETDAKALMISRVLKDQLRWADLIARTGSNEFLIALPETVESDAVVITRKLHERICQRDDSCTVKFGVAGWQKGNNTGDLLDRADEALHGSLKSQDVA